MAKDGTAVLEAPERIRALKAGENGSRRSSGPLSQRRDPVPDLNEEFGRRRTTSRRTEDDPFSDDPVASRKVPGWRLRLRGRVPSSVVGRVVAGVFVLAGLGVIGFGLHEAQMSLLHDARLVIPSSKAIEISGNNHLTRAQLLSVFGEDVDRNLLTVPLSGRRAELEALPWVEHATVMRLLPNKVRVSIVERTPVAFVRQGGEIGLVDAHGVLLDLAPDAISDHAYSFPVVTGIAATDPVGTRAARMRLYLQFTGDLDAGPEKISKKLSEVDLSDPEDIKALIPESGADVLVHFGSEDFLQRYQRYVQNLPDWKTKYPKLASVDMRYEREVVLEMAPGATVPVTGSDPNTAAPGTKVAAPVVVAKKIVAKKAGAKVVVRPKAAMKKPAAKPAAAKPVAGHLQKSFDVHPKVGPR